MRKPGETLEFVGTTSQPAYFLALTSHADGTAEVCGSTTEPLEPGQPFDFKVGFNKEVTGRVAIKVFATGKPLDAATLSKVSSEKLCDALLGQLKKIAPADGDDLLGTRGWAEYVVWVEFRK